MLLADRLRLVCGGCALTPAAKDPVVTAVTASAGTSASVGTGIVAEVAVYTVTKPATFGELQKQAHARVAKFPGFLRSLALRSRTVPNRYADVVFWSSQEAAMAAAAAGEQAPELADFMAGIAGIEAFNHFHPKTSGHLSPAGLDADALVADLQGAGVVEVFVYQAADPAAQRRLHPLLHQTLQGYLGRGATLLARVR